MEFDDATAVQRLTSTRYRAQIQPEWFGGAGPSGGYLAAILLRALTDTVRERERIARTLHCQFLRPPTAGLVDVHVRVRKVGRRVTFLGASLAQAEHPCVVASAVFALAGDATDDYLDLKMPRIPSAEELSRAPTSDSDPPIFGQLDMRPAIGPAPLSGADQSLGGGWIRLRPARVCDPMALCLYADGWFPSPTSRMRSLPSSPTIEYSIYFRGPTTGSYDGGDHVLVKVSSLSATEGFFDEDALVWSPDGALLAQARQYAVLR